LCSTIFVHKTGWRASEISNLSWGNVDFGQGIVQLETGETRNKKDRTVLLDNELLEIFNQQKRRQRQSGKLSIYIFPNEDGTSRIISVFKVFVGSA
jgi:integrase